MASFLLEATLKNDPKLFDKVKEGKYFLSESTDVSQLHWTQTYLPTMDSCFEIAAAHNNLRYIYMLLQHGFIR